jgi:putative DNA primase/helicase
MNLSEILQAFEANKGRISIDDIKEIFNVDDDSQILVIFQKMIEENKISLVDNGKDLFFVLNDYFNKLKSVPVTNLLPPSVSFENSLEDAEKELIREYIRDKNVPAIANFLAKKFVELYNVKSFLNSNTIQGIFCFDGRKYIEADDYALKYLEEALRKFEPELVKEKIKKISIVREYIFKVKFSYIFKINEMPIISFKNCVLDWEGFKYANDNSFLQHSPNLILFNHIDFEINKEKLIELVSQHKYEEIGVEEIENIANELCPNALRIFKDWVGEKWILLFELIGYCFYPKYIYNKAVMLVGDGSNGKSTFLRLLKTILSAENIVGISLQELCENNFAFSSLYHKLANIYPDLPKAPLRYTGQFKLATGEDFISADRKFKERITFENYAKMFFSANELPFVSDMTTAFWRRWLVVEFKNKFAPVENFFEKNFNKEEIEGVVNVSILAFRNVLMRNKFSFEETETDYKEIWLRKSDSIYAFLSDLKKNKIIEDVPGEKTETQILYEKYLEYCNLEEIDAVSKKSFTERMEQYGYPVVRSGNKKFYKNIKVNI